MGLLTDLLGDGNATSAATQLLHVRDEKAANTHGGASVAASWNIRTLNTIKTNEIAGASLATNVITLPAGTYEADIRSPVMRVQAHRARLYDVTNSVALILGESGNSDSAEGSMVSSIRGRFTLAAVTNVRVEHYTTAAVASFGLGFATNQGTEVYTDLMIRKVA